MGNKYKFYFIIKEDYLLDESRLVNAHKRISQYEKNQEYPFKHKGYHLIILNHDNLHFEPI